ncbi:MAG: SAM-dependent DNA methyltransferase [Chitinophagaceae bacterium]|nr:SAM-dependent DNA methyltransferase [Chitinophagaceae bacterium]
MNHIQHNQIVNFIWGIADDVLRDVYTRGKYRDIILPFTVLRRLDALLEPSKDKVIEMHEQLNKLKIENQSPQLRKVSGYVFYNTSKYTFKKLLNDPANIRQNLENYLDGFSSDVQDIISKFKLRNQLDTLEEGNITFPLIEKFCSFQINLSPVAVKDKDGNIVHEGLSNLGMGYVFEELIRKFNEENNEEAGEHFTPREIIKLMTHLIFEPVKNKIKQGTYLIYDPACGSGGMLTEAEHFALEINPKATYHLYGQEVNPETFAICKADMLIKEEDPEKIAFGSTLSNDGFPKLKFDFMLSNPPYGKTWKVDQDSIVDSKTKEILDSRFSVGVPRVSDGQLLFLMNMVSKMKADSEIGSRIASVHNGSSLFTGEAGGGESEIRKYIIENDLLEAIIQLPNDMFYNTGIATYIWVLSNKKEERRKGKVQLIDASGIYSKMRKGLGSKSNELTETHIQQIADAFKDFQQNEISRIFENDDFAYWSITVERPLRLAWQLTEEKLSAMEDTDYYLPVLKTLQKQFGTAVQNDFNQLLSALDTQLKKLSLTWKPKEKKTFLDALSWRDGEAKPVIKKQNKDEVIYEADPELRDYESVPVKQNVQEYFEKEVWPFVPDAWIDHSKTVKGYEVSFTKIFYRYQPLRSVAAITEEIMQLERETEGLLNDIIS